MQVPPHRKASKLAKRVSFVLSNVSVSTAVSILILLIALIFQVIACLDVRSNDNGDLVVTKGDQYDVRDHSSSKEVSNFVH